MHLIVAEKPSAARNFSKALGGSSGTYDGVEYRICALRGHLLGLLPPDKQVDKDKAEEMKKWALERLPWDLAELSWKKGIGRDCREVLDNLKDELESADTVVIATDVDPSGEGELLAWEALEWAGWNGPTERMYFADEAPKSVQKAFKQRTAIPSKEKDGDFVKATVRERWDFASMQFVRAATCVAREAGFRSVVRQGRLKSVMVQLVGDQLKAYNEYVKKPYYEARFKDANGNVFSRTTEDLEAIRFPSPDAVDLSGLHESGITEDYNTEKHTAPGKLLDLAGLSAILAKKGYKPDSVLATYQKMYEDQVVSYPRTEDKQITHEQFEELLPLANDIAAVVGVDAKLLTHTAPRRSHVKEGGAHGANRPGTNVPKDLDSLSKYGKEAPAIYELLARNYLAMLCEDYEYTLVKAYVTDFPEYRGEVHIPRSLGFKAVFDSEAESSDDSDDSTGNEFAEPAVPYVHEGANKRPQKPTMKWLNKRLEKFNVGTGATRTSTLAEISKNEERALMKESKGALTLTTCGEVSYALLEGCQIASPEVTEKLFESMEKVGRFEADPNAVISTVTGMVIHDRDQMIANKGKLAGMKLGGSSDRPVIGKCPLCGQDVKMGEKSFQCSSNKFRKTDDGKFEQTEGCGFSVFRTVAGKKLSEKQGMKLLKDGRTSLIKGMKGKSGKSFDAYVVLDKATGKTGFEFDKSKKKGK